MIRIQLLKKVKTSINDLHVTSQQLATGIVLSRDLRNHNGDFLLRKGVKLADSTVMLPTELVKSAKKEFQLFIDIPIDLEVPRRLLKNLYN